MLNPPSGPTIMGIDVIYIATALSAVATFAVLVALYLATTVRDPMAKRVKALNERREQLKAGIVASTNKRRKNITNKNELGDRVRGWLSSLKMLQDDQVQKAQQRLVGAAADVATQHPARFPVPVGFQGQGVSVFLDAIRIAGQRLRLTVAEQIERVDRSRRGG